MVIDSLIRDACTGADADKFGSAVRHVIRTEIFHIQTAHREVHTRHTVVPSGQGTKLSQGLDHLVQSNLLADFPASIRLGPGASRNDQAKSTK